MDTFLNSLAGEIPLVVAFVFFTLRIIAIYQASQEKRDASFEAMIIKITNNWSDAQEKRDQAILEVQRKRDQEAENFMKEIKENDRFILQQISADLKANTQILSVDQGILLSAQQIMTDVSDYIRHPPDPVPAPNPVPPVLRKRQANRKE